jgi:hypothetical protein
MNEKGVNQKVDGRQEKVEENIHMTIVSWSPWGFITKNLADIHFLPRYLYPDGDDGWSCLSRGISTRVSVQHGIAGKWISGLLALGTCALWPNRTRDLTATITAI